MSEAEIDSLLIGQEDENGSINYEGKSCSTSKEQIPWILHRSVLITLSLKHLYSYLN